MSQAGARWFLLVTTGNRPESNGYQFDTDEDDDGKHDHHESAVEVEDLLPDGIGVGLQILNHVSQRAAEGLCRAQQQRSVKACVDVDCNPEREGNQSDCCELFHILEHLYPLVRIFIIRKYKCNKVNIRDCALVLRLYDK